MGIYTTTKCGHCNSKWQKFERGSHSMVGPPKIKCSECKKINHTSLKLYRDINIWQKFKFWIGQIFYRCIYGLLSFIIGTALLALLIKGLVKKEDWSLGDLLGFIPFLIIAISLIYYGIRELIDIFYTKKAYKTIEDIYDRNNGYLESNQFF